MNDLIVADDRAHARISPSGFARAEACTKSVQLAPLAPPLIDGADALIGTAAHALLEKCLREGIDTIELGDIRSVTVKGTVIDVDGDMLDGVQLCLDFVRTSELLKGRRIEVERRLILPFAAEYGMPMFGFADVLAPELPVVVVDYKNGFNVVEASTVQLGLYIMAAAIAVNPSLQGDGAAGTAVIVQPNAQGEPIRTHEWTWADLWELRERVIAVLQRVRAGDWSYQTGEHCRWCPAAGICPQLAAVARDAALTAVVPTPEMVASGEISREQLDDWLTIAPTIEHWLRKLHDTAFDYLVHGGKLDSSKLVRKRSNRRWIDEAGAQAELEKLGCDPWQKKLVSPAEAERRLPKAKHEHLSALAEKPIGDLTLAAKDDSRAEVNVGATLQAALQSSVAAGFLAAADMRTAKGQNAK